MSYSITEPFASGLMSTGDGHDIYWEQCGRPDGKPAVVLHGGPGSGCRPYLRGLFNPDVYRVVLFDQRGCGRSRPNACDDPAALQHNTTQHLIADIEQLRDELGIDAWLVFGGSWGSTLGLAYAVEYPQRVSELLLTAVVTTRARDIAWITHTMGSVYPQEFDELLAAIPAEHRDGNIAAAIHELTMSEDPTVGAAAADAWIRWEDRVATLSGDVEASPLDGRQRLGFARLVTHYFGNYGFLADDAITGRLSLLSNIPTHLLRGRLDISSPLRSAYEVANAIPGARLEILEWAGHAADAKARDRISEVLDGFAH